eukprot:114920_1
MAMENHIFLKTESAVFLNQPYMENNIAFIDTVWTLHSDGGEIFKEKLESMIYMYPEILDIVSPKHLAKLNIIPRSIDIPPTKQVQINTKFIIFNDRTDYKTRIGVVLQPMVLSPAFTWNHEDLSIAKVGHLSFRFNEIPNNVDPDEWFQQCAWGVGYITVSDDYKVLKPSKWGPRYDYLRARNLYTELKHKSKISELKHKLNQRLSDMEKLKHKMEKEHDDLTAAVSALRKEFLQRMLIICKKIRSNLNMPKYNSRAAFNRLRSSERVSHQVMNKCCDQLETVATQCFQRGGYTYYKDIDYDGLAALVGADELQMKQDGNTFTIENINASWSKSTINLTFSYYIMYTDPDNDVHSRAPN